MKKKSIERLARELLPKRPEYRAKGDLLIITPIGSVLRGFCFESSSFSATRVSVHAFIQPMYLPRDHVVLSLGFRVGADGRDWDSNDPDFAPCLRKALCDEAVQFLDSVDSPADVPGAIDRLSAAHPLVGSHALDAKAYSYVRMGDAERAVEALRRVVEHGNSAARSWESKGSAPPRWILESTGRALSLLELVQRSPQEAISRLESWEIETIRHLKLEEFL